VTAREQRALIRRAAQGGAFGIQYRLDRWGDVPFRDDLFPEKPSPEKLAMAYDIALDVEDFLGEPAWDRFSAFTRALFDFEVAREQKVSDEFWLAFEEFFRSNP
jgi:hypothetical protein